LSPFATALRRLRTERGMKQEELATALGCGRGYIAQMEVDMKPPPSAQFVRDLAARLELAEQQGAELMLAREMSQRRYDLPQDLSCDAYELAYRFHMQIDQLNGSQMRIIKETLNVREGAPATPGDPDRPIRRRDRGKRRKEDNN